jgi:hypothetical protein
VAEAKEIRGLNGQAAENRIYPVTKLSAKERIAHSIIIPEMF